MVAFKTFFSIALLCLLFSCSDYFSGKYPTMDMEDSQAITILFPDSGAVLSKQSSYTITWSSSFSSLGYVSLTLMRNSVPYQIIDSSYYSDGDYSWSPSSSLSTSLIYRIKITSCADTSIYGLSGPFTLTSSSQGTYTSDSYEPDNAYTQATLLTVGADSQAHTITPADSDWFTFAAHDDSTYIIQTFGSMDTRLWVYQGDTGHLFDSDDDDGIGSNAAITMTCDSTVTIYFKVTGFSSSTSGYYGIKVMAIHSPSYTITRPGSGTVWQAGVKDTVRWTTASGYTGSTVSLYLYDVNSLVQTIAYSTDDTGLFVWYTSSSLPSGNSYSIKIVNPLFPNTSVFSPLFSIRSSSESDTYENDDSAAVATRILSDSMDQIHTLDAGDQDWFSFSASTGTVYGMRTTGETDTWIQLYQSDGQTLMQVNDDGASGQNAQVIWTCETNGTYYFRVSGFSSAAKGAYTIALYEGTNPSIYISRPMAHEGLVQDMSSTIAWTTGGSTGRYCAISLFNDTVLVQRLAEKQYLYSGSNNFYWLVPSSVDTGSAYRIVVSDLSNPACANSSAFFTIMASALADSSEPNDSVSQAIPLTPGDSLALYTITTNDIDWFSFSATAGTTYVMGTNNTNNAVVLYLIDSNGTTQISPLPSYSATTKITWTCTIAGTYYIKVAGNEPSTVGTYTLTIHIY